MCVRRTGAGLVYMDGINPNAGSLEGERIKFLNDLIWSIHRQIHRKTAVRQVGRENIIGYAKPTGVWHEGAIGKSLNTATIAIIIVVETGKISSISGWESDSTDDGGV